MEIMSADFTHIVYLQANTPYVFTEAERNKYQGIVFIQAPMGSATVTKGDVTIDFFSYYFASIFNPFALKDIDTIMWVVPEGDPNGELVMFPAGVPMFFVEWETERPSPIVVS